MNIIGIAIGVFLVFVFLGGDKRRNITNRILASLIIVIIGIITASVLWETKSYTRLPHLLGIFPAFYFLLGPCLFLYTCSIAEKDFSLNPKTLLHSIPFIFNIVSNIPFFLQSSEVKIRGFFESLSEPGFDYHFFTLLRLIHVFVYLFFTIRLLSRHEKNIKQLFSNIEHIKLRWIKYLLFVTATFLSTYVIFYISWISANESYTELSRLLTIWEPMMLIIIGYKGLTQPEILLVENNDNKSKKYKDSTLSKQDSERYLEELRKLMMSSRPYTDPDLTLGTLAKQVNLLPRHLSQIINEQLHQNFYDFINGYRVEEVKKQLMKEGKKDSTFFEMALNSGFNSKSTFNSSFKKHTGMSPSQFLKSHHK